jgi:hypothetical protein
LYKGNWFFVEVRQFAGKFGKREGMLALVKIPDDSRSVIYQLCNAINYWVTLQKS